jgi:hypothetical protein
MFAAAPIAQMQWSHLVERSIVQLFTSNTAFVSAQAFGWLCYVLSLAGFLIYLVNDNGPVASGNDGLLRMLPLSFVAQLIVMCSFVYLEPRAEGPVSDSPPVAVIPRMPDPAATSSYIRASSAVGFGALIGCIVVDVCFWCEVYLPIPAQWLLAFIFVACVASSCLVHVGAFAKLGSYKLWQPFEGGAAFVFRQSLGWMLLSLSLLAQLIIAAAPKYLAGKGWLVSSCGVFILSHGLLRASIQFFRDDDKNADDGANSDSKPIPASVSAHSEDVAQVDWLLQMELRPKLRAYLEGIKEQLLRGPTASREVCHEPLFPGTNAASSSEVTWHSAFLRLVAFFCAVVSFILTVSADAFRGLSSMGPWPVSLLFGSGMLIGLCGAIFTHVVCGPNSDKRYKRFQPFQGGLYFVLCQAMGWSFFANALMFASLCIAWGPSDVVIDGLLSAVGALLFAAQIVLIVSLDQFDGSSAHPILNGIFESPGARWLSDNLVSVILSFGSLALFMLADAGMVRSGANFAVLPMVILAIVSTIAAITLTCWLAPDGPPRAGQQNSGKRFRRYPVVQILGWALWSFTLVFGLLMVARALAADSSKGLLPQAPKVNLRTGFSAGLSGLGAQLLVLYSFSPEASTMKPRKEAMPGEMLKLTQGVANFLGKPVLHLPRWKPLLPAVRSVNLAGVLLLLFATKDIVFGGLFERLSTVLGNGILLTCLCLGYPFVQLLAYPEKRVVATKFAAGIGAWVHRRASEVMWVVGLYVILPALRSFLNTPMVWFGRYHMFRDDKLSTDGQPVTKDVKVVLGVQYGPRPTHVMDVVSPASPASKEDPVVFCHGGGFVCVQGELLMPSMTFVARYGMTMYSVNYPFAPEEAFPSQVVAILRACAWIKKHSGQSTVKLIGDSAGGSLVRL